VPPMHTFNYSKSGNKTSFHLSIMSMKASETVYFSSDEKRKVQVQTGFKVVLPSLNVEPGLWSGSAQPLNLELNFGQVRKSSGSNFGSELNCGNPSSVVV
jgi:hypothetical protein